MAISVKTRELYFPVLTAATSGTETSFTSITIPIPESSIHFKEVVFELSANDFTSTATTYTRRQLSIQLDANGFSVINNTQPLTNSGENITIFHSYDFTDYFNTFWTGTSMTCDARTIITQTAQRDLTLKVTLTYTYDTDSAIHAKTVWLPIGTRAAALPTTKTALDSLPALDTYLPEDNKQYNQVTIVVEGNDYGTNQTPAQMVNATLIFEIDNSGSFASLARAGGLDSSRYFRYTAQPNYMSGSGGLLHLWSGLSTLFNNLNVYLNVDYNFSPTSNRIFNSVIFGLDTGGINSSGFDTQKLFFTSSFVIKEPGEISFQTSSLLLSDFGTSTKFYSSSVYFNNNTNRKSEFNQINVASIVCGDFNHTNMLVSHSLNSGKNHIYTTIIPTTAVNDKLVTPYFVLNYTSDRSPQGVHLHNKTIILNRFSGNTVGTTASISYTSSMVENSYYVNSYIERMRYSSNSTSQPPHDIIRLNDKVIYHNIQSALLPEVGYRMSHATITDKLSRWNNCILPNLPSIESSSFNHAITPISNVSEISSVITYHGFKYLVSGSILGSAGGTVTIDLYDTATDSKVLTTSRTGNGSYSFNWHEDTVPIYVVARETDTLKGTSRIGFAGSGSYDIGLFYTTREYLF